jgi:hypothetical protein
MTDWPAWVRKRLGALDLPPERETEIVNELAHHFEDLEAEASQRGPSEALAKANREVPDWARFRKKILGAESGEGRMKHRMTSLWLPGLASAGLGVLALMLVQLYGHPPGMVWFGQIGMPVYPVWLAALPFAGAAGAFISWRARGTKSEIFLSTAFLPATLAALFVCIVPVGLVTEHFTGHGALTLQGFAVGMLGWVIIPGIHLAIGSTPFILARRSARPAPNLAA